MTAPALCQCVRCLRYLAVNRTADTTAPQLCVDCHPYSDGSGDVGIPLAEIRGPLTVPLDAEVIALVDEEAGEVIQRSGKIRRWGWKADFGGTTQLDKYHTELGDVLAAMLVAAYNGIIDLPAVISACRAKLDKFREDAAGPRQRLTVAAVPPATCIVLTVPPR